MSRKITIAVSGATVPEYSEPHTQEALRFLQEFWLAELEHFVSEKPDLIVLPECSDRFRGMDPAGYREFCAFRKDAMLKLFRQWAIEHHCMIAYCANGFDDSGNYRNRILLIDREGNVCATYNKNYPTETELQVAGIVPGEDITVVDCEFGRIGFAICFDLNFNALFDKYRQAKPDLLLFSSVFHGGPLQQQRSRECECFFIGSVSGERSSILDPQGELAAESSNYIPRLTATVNLDCKVVHYDNNFEKLDQLKAYYGRDAVIRDPGRVGSVLLTSESDQISAGEMLRKFDIEDNASYFRRTELLADEYRKRRKK